MKIVLVDDDPIFTFIFTTFVEQYKDCTIQLDKLSNGQEALTYMHKQLSMREKLPDLLFVDINMPVMNGWELLDAIKKELSQHLKHIPIYILTSSIAIQDRKKWEDYGFVNGYITKPLRKEDLFFLIDNHRLDTKSKK